MTHPTSNECTHDDVLPADSPSHKGQHFCFECGRYFVLQPIEALANERSCKGCEHNIPWDWVFCAWCGFENDKPESGDFPPAVETTALLMMNDIPYHTIPQDIIDKVVEVRRWFDERNVKHWSVAGIGPLHVETSASVAEYDAIDTTNPLSDNGRAK